MVTDRHKGLNLALGNATNKWSLAKREESSYRKQGGLYFGSHERWRDIDKEAHHADSRLSREERGCVLSYVDSGL